MDSSGRGSPCEWTAAERLSRASPSSEVSPAYKYVSYEHVVRRSTSMHAVPPLQPCGTHGHRMQHQRTSKSSRAVSHLHCLKVRATHLATAASTRVLTHPCSLRSATASTWALIRRLRRLPWPSRDTLLGFICIQSRWPPAHTRCLWYTLRISSNVAPDRRGGSGTGRWCHTSGDTRTSTAPNVSLGPLKEGCPEPLRDRRQASQPTNV